MIAIRYNWFDKSMAILSDQNNKYISVRWEEMTLDYQKLCLWKPFYSLPTRLSWHIDMIDVVSSTNICFSKAPSKRLQRLSIIKNYSFKHKKKSKCTIWYPGHCFYLHEIGSSDDKVFLRIQLLFRINEHNGNAVWNVSLSTSGSNVLYQQTWIIHIVIILEYIS